MADDIDGLAGMFGKEPPTPEMLEDLRRARAEAEEQLALNHPTVQSRLAAADRLAEAVDGEGHVKMTHPGLRGPVCNACGDSWPCRSATALANYEAKRKGDGLE